MLCHRVEKEGLHPYAGNLGEIMALTVPSKGEEVLRCLDLNFFSSFYDHFQTISKLLYDIFQGTGLCKKIRLGQKSIVKYWKDKWGPDLVKSWTELKESLRNPAILVCSGIGDVTKWMMHVRMVLVVLYYRNQRVYRSQ